MTNNLKEVLVYLTDYRRLNKKAGPNNGYFDPIKSLELVLQFLTNMLNYDTNEVVRSTLLENVSYVLLDSINKLSDNVQFIDKILGPAIGNLCRIMANQDMNLQSNLMDSGLSVNQMVGKNQDSNSNDNKTREVNLRSLHYEILQKLRFSDYKIRYAGLLVIENIITSIGLTYENLWPEAMPIFYELFEDDSQKVEAKTREICRKIKGIIGDNMEGF